jgi:hypothetical protein
MSMAINKNILRKTGKIFLWILTVILSLVLLLIIFINLPAGKRTVKNQITKYLSNKLKTRIEIGSVDYSLPKWVELKNVYVEDQKKDTLFYGEQLSVDLDMVKLLQGNTEIHKVLFKNIVGNISRTPNDSVFNYQFIVNAFTGNKSTTPNTDTAEMKLSLDRLIFENVGLNFKDEYAGNNFQAVIKNLEVTTTNFHPDRVIFGINEFTASGVKFHMNTYKELPAENAPVSARDSVVKSPYELFISASNINLRDVDVLIDNKVSGMYYSNNVTHLTGKNILFTIGSSTGTADELSLDSSSIVFSAPKKIPEKIKTDSAVAPAIPWLFAAKNLNIRNTNIKYDDNNIARAGGLDFSHLNAKNITAAVAGFKFSKDTTSALVNQFRFSDTSGFALDTTHVNFLMTDTLISATELYVKTPRSLIQKSFSIRFDSLAAMTTVPQNSLVNATLINSTISFNDLYLLSPALETSLPKAQFANQFLNVNTELRGNLQRLYIPYLQLSGLSGSKLSGSGTVYNISDPKKLSYDLYFNQMNLFKKDLLKFVPPENQKQLASLPDIINLKGRVKGNMNDVIADISASAKDMSFTGRVGLKNFMDPARIVYNIAISKATVSKNVIAGFLPPELLQQLELPAQVSASGKFDGNTDNITMDLKAGSSYGPLTVKGYIKNMQDPQRANYDLALSTPGFAVGRLIKQDSVIGNVAGNFKAKGKGYDYKTMRSSITADVASLEYNKYTYRNALINADLNNGLIKSTGNINDDNLKLNYALNANVKNQYPTISGEIRVDTARLNALHLTKDTLNFSASAVIDSKSLQPRSLDASLLIDSLRMQSGTKFYQLDSASLIASSVNGIDSIVLKAPFADIHAGGAFDYDKIGTSIQNYVNNYYKIPGYTPVTTNIPEQQFAVKGVIRQSPIITGFVPGLNNYSDINFTGSYTSADTDSALNFNATIPMVSYTDARLANGTIGINSKNGRINYAAAFDTLTTAGNVLYASRISGGAAKDSISLTAVTKDETNRDWFGLSGSAYVKDETYSFRMQDTLILNYEKWNVAPDNYISYSPQGIIVNNLLLTSDTARISLRSQQPVANSPIDIDIANFNLRSISSIVNKDTTLVAGILNVKANVSDLDKALPGFTGTATVTNLEFMQHPVGNITANAQKQSEDVIAANLTLNGYGNDVSAKGNYYLNGTDQQFDADLNLHPLSFKTIETFSAGQITDAAGSISGNIKLNGKFTDPHYNGTVNFDTTRFALAMLGTPYFIDKQSVHFNYPAITFPAFTVKDSSGNDMVLNGSITSKSLMEYDLDMKIKANDFAIVNARRAVNSQAYGFAAIDADVAITGTSAKPNIDGDISLNDKTDIHIVLPEASYAKNDGATIVRFIDRDTFDLSMPALGFEPAQQAPAAFAQFLNYNLNIEVGKAASVTILVDPSTGDEILMKGDARLNAGVDPGGNLVLAGVYALDSGYYDMHYQIINRKFNLIRGSTITFAGEPLNATANITAQYIANTSSKDLLDNEVTDVSSTLANSFNQQLPFRVMLYLTGRLSKPDINFDIQLPESNSLLNNDLRTTIENKLAQIRQDPASVNKQVFSLLLLGRFVGEQSSDFFKGNGGDFSNLARQSVSSFLSSALNEIAADLFKGIDVDLNLNSYNDYSNGGNTERTDLNVAVSKSFANNRLTVTVGQNFGLEGQDAGAKAAGANTGFKPDVSVAYKLSADGRYMIRAYTRNQFEVDLDGYVVETGVAFLVTMDYEKFNELFRKKRNKK